MGGARNDLLIVVLLIIAIGVAWIWAGGPSLPIAHQGGLFSAPWPLGAGGNAYTVPLIPLATEEASTDANAATSGTNTSTQSQSKASMLDYFLGYRPGSLGQVVDPAASPYASSIRLENSGATNSDAKNEYVTIRTGTLKNNITITGWTLESTTSNLKMVIGSAAQIPSLGNINSETPVTLDSDSTVIVTTGRSPNGASFRLNECTGYFAQFQEFSPRLAQDCPRPTDEMLRYPEKTAGNDLCENFVRGLRQCTLTVTAIPGNIGSSCQDFVLTNLSYNGCITAHKNDPDFYRDEWRVFLNRDQELWKNTHDRILLLDENGKLVASTSY
ncbi:MAG: hypothetical protein V4437_03260 [Patescibacteria group bacterium]